MSEISQETEAPDVVGELVGSLTSDQAPAEEADTAWLEEGEDGGGRPPWAEKFQSPEQLWEAYQHAQRKIGEQGNELGKLRQAVREELQQVLPQQPAPASLPLTDDVVSAFDDLVDANPAQAAAWALQTNQPMLYERAMDTWYETAPKDASRFERSVERQREYQAAQIQAQQEKQMQDHFLQTWVSFAQQHPDLPQYGPMMLQIANEQPLLQQAFQFGTPEQRAQVIPLLYDAARARAGQPLSNQSQVAPPAPYVASADNHIADRDDNPQVYDPLGIKQFMRDSIREDQERLASLYGKAD